MELYSYIENYYSQIKGLELTKRIYCGSFNGKIAIGNNYNEVISKLLNLNN